MLFQTLQQKFLYFYFYFILIQVSFRRSASSYGSSSSLRQRDPLHKPRHADEEGSRAG